jgi:hypothetical protein
MEGCLSKECVFMVGTNLSIGATLYFDVSLGV